MKNKIQLITYADSLGDNLQELDFVLKKYFKEEIKGVHVLPFYPSSSDRGFSPLTHLKVDKRFGNWDDIRKISHKHELVADLIVNHISSESKEFKDFLKKGKQSTARDFFITTEKFSSRFDSLKINKKAKKVLFELEKMLNFVRRIDFVFHLQGVNKFVLRKIYRPRIGSPFEMFSFGDGRRRAIWCTFSKSQIDLDINNPRVRRKMKSWIKHLSENGVKLLRLDAVGYCAKKRGTTSFMIPETYDFIKWLGKIAHKNKMEVLPEIHNHYSIQIELAKAKGVDYVYDFCLPLLVLHSIFKKDSVRLKNWIEIRPENQITTLDTHDGVGVIDVEGLLNKEESVELSAHIFRNGGNATMRASGINSDNVDVYQINTTYYSALKENDKDYLIARAIQFFVPGIPQVYYVGLLAGKNDEELLEKTGNGRDVMRHYYKISEIEEAIKRPVVEKLLELMRFRNSYPAFNGKFEMQESSDCELNLFWKKGRSYCKLEINFENKTGNIKFWDTKEREEKTFIF